MFTAVLALLPLSPPGDEVPIYSFQGIDEISRYECDALLADKGIRWRWVIDRIARGARGTALSLGLLCKEADADVALQTLAPRQDISANGLAVGIPTTLDRYFSLPERSVSGPFSLIVPLLRALDRPSVPRLEAILRSPEFRFGSPKGAFARRASVVVRELPDRRIPAAVDLFVMFDRPDGWSVPHRFQWLRGRVVDSGQIQDWPEDAADGLKDHGSIRPPRRFGKHLGFHPLEADRRSNHILPSTSLFTDARALRVMKSSASPLGVRQGLAERRPVDRLSPRERVG